jgi:acyl carrier protein
MMAPAIHEQILAFLEAHFPASLAGCRVAVDTPLFSTGIIDSFGVLELIAFLDETFGVDIDPARHDLADLDTVGKIAILVAALRAQKDSD